MKVIFAGKFESALIRSIDDVLQPARNAATHGYYAGLNRMVTRNYFERCGTFIALAKKTLVPNVDWNFPYDQKYRGELTNVDLGVEIAEPRAKEWDEKIVRYVEDILKQPVLSEASRRYIANLTFLHYPEDARKHMEANRIRYEGEAARHYLCRLFLQLHAGRTTNSYCVVSENDIEILEEIGRWAVSGKTKTYLEIPDLRGKLIEPESFVSGLLNFAPPDIQSVGAVRSDKQIRKYAEKVFSVLDDLKQSNDDRERKMLGAMIEAHEKSEAGKRAEKVFEIVSWVVKPLHYIPGVDAALSVAEDIKDVAAKVLERGIVLKDWHLVAVKMADIAWRDYLNRKSNVLSR
jgi:hypothetical protein